MAVARENTGQDERALAAFVEARAQGDAEAAARAWGELLTARYDFIAGHLRLKSHGYLRRGEQDEALSDVLLDLATKGPGSFAGSSLGEWVNFVKQVVFRRCVDVQRKATGRSGHEVRLDLQNSDGDDYVNPAVASALADSAAAAEALTEDVELLAHGRKFLAWALPQLTDKRRQVMELTFEELPCSVIEERLGLSQAAVHQNRSRGTTDLHRLAKEWPGR